jgi:hypothetical protein
LFVGGVAATTPQMMLSAMWSMSDLLEREWQVRLLRSSHPHESTTFTTTKNRRRLLDYRSELSDAQVRRERADHRCRHRQRVALSYLHRQVMYPRERKNQNVFVSVV